MASKLSNGAQRHSFSVSFQKQEMCEGRQQNKMAKLIGSQHHDIPFTDAEIVKLLETAIYHTECPLKESYDTACLALSQAARTSGVPVVLTGQGADELFAGYIGYRFDKFKHERPRLADEEELQERKLRAELWGDPLLVYDTNYSALKRLKAGIYSEQVLEQFDDFDCFKSLPINRDYLYGRHYIHKRSYLDLKLRLADHLLGDHGDRMSMANSVEARHPFLDVEVANFAAQIPPDLKLRGLEEKYVVKEAARPFVPREIVDREKFGWFAPGTPALLRSQSKWMEERLSAERVKKEGYFNPIFIENLKQQYKDPGFSLNQPFESDLLMIALTFSMFLEIFNIPALN
jgi:asparagine synthase (glutamine-hydrolysing)